MSAAQAVVQGVAMIAMPIVAIAWWRGRAGVSSGRALAGALTFVASQFIHVPLLLWLQPQRWQPFWLAALALGLLAGLCEELSRHAMFVTIRSARRFEDGVMAGLGHGGVESALLGLAVILGAFLPFAAMPGFLGAGVPMAAAAGADSVNFLRLVAVLERAMAMTFHVAASAMVLEGIRTRQRAWLAGAVAFHTALDAGAVLAWRTWGIAGAEGVVAASVPVSIAILVLLRRRAQPSAS